MRKTQQPASLPAHPAAADVQRPSSVMKPIGLLGGSFDPVHVGHLQLARDARDRLGLAEVRLIPAAQPWQKGPITDPAHRARMIALAIADEPGLVLDMHEIERGGPSYTIDTLRALRASLGPAQPLVLIIGADQMARLDTWRDWQSLTDLAHLAVAHRNDAPPVLNPTLAAYRARHPAERALLQARPHGAIVELPMTPVDASATEIRALLSEPPSAAGRQRLAALLPAPVLLYIRRERLYSPHAQLAPREKEKTESMDLQKLQRVVVDALEDVKAQDIKVFNTIGLSDMFDRVVLASGTSNRQSRALAWSVVEKVKAAGGHVVSVEGTDPGEWVLVDLGDIVVHIMQPAIRQYYGLEEMWGSKPIKVKLAAELRGNRPGRDEAAIDTVAPGAAATRRQAPTPARSTATKATTGRVAASPRTAASGAPRATTLPAAAPQGAARKAVRKAGPKKAPPKKTAPASHAVSATRATAAKKPPTAKKAAPKRTAPTTAASRKDSSKKTAPATVAQEKAAPRKSAPTTAASKMASLKKTAPTTAAPKKATPRKTATAASKSASATQAAANRKPLPAKKVAPKRTAAPAAKPPARKAVRAKPAVAAKKTAAKKATPGKKAAAAKKTTPGKKAAPAARRAAVRPPARGGTRR